MTWYHGWHPWYFWWDSLDRSSASGLVRSYLLFISKYLDILISWKINQLRSLYHQSDKFPFLPNLLLIEAAINQFGLKLKLVLYQAGGGDSEQNSAVSAILLLHVIVLLVAVKIFAGPWQTPSQTTSVALICLPVHPAQYRDWNDSPLSPPFMSGFPRQLPGCRIQGWQFTSN